jgi:hypothetical protein
MPQPPLTPGKEPVPIVQEAEWAPGPVWTGTENLVPTGIRSPDCPAHSWSLYWLCYPAHSFSETPMILMWGRWHISLPSCPCASDCEKHYGLYEYCFEKTILYPCIFLSLNTIHNTLRWMFVIVRFASGSRYCIHNKTGVSRVLITNENTEVYAGIMSCYARLMLYVTDSCRSITSQHTITNMTVHIYVTCHHIRLQMNKYGGSMDLPRYTDGKCLNRVYKHYHCELVSLLASYWSKSLQQCDSLYMCVCVCIYMCVCVCVWVGRFHPVIGHEGP